MLKGARRWVNALKQCRRGIQEQLTIGEYLPEALLNNGKTEILLPKDRLVCLNVLF